MRRSILLTLIVLAAACGKDTTWRDLVGKCSSLDDQKNFLKLWTDDLYLWYREVPAVDIHDSNYPDAVSYFKALKTPLLTASNTPKDKFHFTADTLTYQQQSQAGLDIGYGFGIVALASPCPTSSGNGCAPRDWRIAYVEPGSPAANAGIGRAMRIAFVDGVDFVNAADATSVKTINAGLFPATAGEQHTFVFCDLATCTTLSAPFQLTAAAVTETPVIPFGPFKSSTGANVGYILFKDHIATAEPGLISAISSFKGVDDLVIDMRYNGGGYLAISDELAYMVAGPKQTSGKYFERLAFNDKHPTNDPVTGALLTPIPFVSNAQGFTSSSPPTLALPSLALPRVFILTGPGTCSASESVINGLMGAGVQVIQIGGTTCGKPYGFYPQDDCGTTYFSIQFQGFNFNGFGDYGDGFVPNGGGSNPVGCKVADDWGHQLGDPAEGLLAAALAYTAPCPPALTISDPLRKDGVPVKPEWLMNRVLRR